MQKHPFEPFFDKNSKVLILGSFPSKDSQKGGFYYQSPSNRFYRILERLYSLENKSLNNIKTQQEFLKRQGIALWDIFATINSEDSKDSSIDMSSKETTANNLNHILNQVGKIKIFTTGKKAYEGFCQFYPHLKAQKLPSSSGATRISLDELIEKYKKIKSD